MVFKYVLFLIHDFVFEILIILKILKNSHNFMIQRVHNALLYDKTILDLYFLRGNIVQNVISILFPV